MKEQKKIFPDEMIPYEGTVIVKGRDDEDYIIKNTAMYTGIQHSQAEHSLFFLALKDRCIILGRRCASCGTLEVPPAKLRCPKCSFQEMDVVEVTDKGSMEASPPVVCFAPSLFKKEVPYANGYVRLLDKYGKECTGAIKLRIRTTKGLMRPGIVKWQDEVKVVFRDEREESIRDIFAVPARELTEEQFKKSPLFESDLVWATEADLEREYKKEFDAERELVVLAFQDFADRVARSRRAQKDLSHWKSVIRVITDGGEFNITIDNGKLIAADGQAENPGTIFSVTRPSVFFEYLDRGYALTNLFLEGKLNLSKLDETVFKLDRLPRSLKRDNV